MVKSLVSLVGYELPYLVVSSFYPKVDIDLFHSFQGWLASTFGRVLHFPMLIIISATKIWEISGHLDEIVTVSVHVTLLDAASLHNVITASIRGACCQDVGCFITARKRSFGQGNVFTGVRDSVHGGLHSGPGGGGLVPACLAGFQAHTQGGS